MSKTIRICCIPECTRKHLSRGWCSDHYYRWAKYGDPLAALVRARPGVPWRYYKDTVWLVTDNCKIWPYAGPEGDYGYVWPEGRKYGVHHLACLAWNGPPPPGHEAAHGPCHDRKCYNGAHLSWETPRRNAEHRRRDGTHLFGETNPAARLTEQQVLEIRVRLAAGETGLAMASAFQISPSLVSAIRTKKLWAHVE